MEFNNIENIIEGCKKNNRFAQELLYKLYAAKMYSICLRYISDRDNAKDVLQDGFLKVFKKINMYEFKGSIEAWIRRIIINTAIDFIRKKKRLKETEFEGTYENTISETNENDEKKIEVPLKDLLSIIEELPEKARLVFNLYAIEELSHKEIAKLLGISEGTSKSQYARAKKLLREKLTKYYN